MADLESFDRGGGGGAGNFDSFFFFFFFFDEGENIRTPL